MSLRDAILAGRHSVKKVRATLGLADLRKTVKTEIRDPYGKVNCYVGLVLLAFFVVAFGDYLLGSVDLDVGTKYVTLHADRSTLAEALLLLGVLALTLVYWMFCLNAFREVRAARRVPEESDE